MKYVDEIWERDWLTNQGPLHHRLEDALKHYLQVENLTLTVNGHLALEIAIRGLGLTRRSDHNAVYVCLHDPFDCNMWI